MKISCCALVVDLESGRKMIAGAWFSLAMLLLRLFTFAWHWLAVELRALYVEVCVHS